MHEFSLAASLVQYVSDVAEKNGMAEIKEIHIEVGEMTHIDPRQLKFCIKIASQDTIADGSRVFIKKRMPVLKCLKCGTTSELKGGKNLSDYTMACPSCGSQDVELERGKELVLKRIKGIRKGTPG
ncbi:MAG: hydrogenase maturation nickel metallochaperone HypA [Candidatus Methanosuratincola sp.]